MEPTLEVKLLKNLQFLSEIPLFQRLDQARVSADIPENFYKKRLCQKSVLIPTPKSVKLSKNDEQTSSDVRSFKNSEF
jgi:hypothetical protein